jgi:hypothetical protein
MQAQIKGIEDEKPEEQPREVKNPCPKCGAELEFQGGCNVCKSCGWTKCERSRSNRRGPCPAISFPVGTVFIGCIPSLQSKVMLWIAKSF